MGVITPQNSLVGRTDNAGLAIVVWDQIQKSVLACFVSEGGGRVTMGLTDPNEFTYARGQAQTVNLTPDFLTATLNTGTAVVLQASNDITVKDPITVNAGGHGGALTLQAGRSIILNADITTDNGPLTLSPTTGWPTAWSIPSATPARPSSPWLAAPPSTPAPLPWMSNSSMAPA
jgi:hypothetical protein